MVELSPPSLSLSAILTNLVIVVGFIGAIIAGLWKGWREIRNTKEASPAESDMVAQTSALDFMRASLDEAQAMRDLVRSSETLDKSVRDLDRNTSNVAEELRQNRLAISRAGDSMDRLAQVIERNTQAMERTWG